MVHYEKVSIDFLQENRFLSATASIILALVREPDIGMKGLLPFRSFRLMVRD
jgi:hypothetical protein